MLHRILKQLRDRDRERGRHLGGNVSEPPSTSIVTGNEIVLVSRIMLTSAETISSKGTCSVTSRAKMS